MAVSGLDVSSLCGKLHRLVFAQLIVLFCCAFLFAQQPGATPTPTPAAVPQPETTSTPDEEDTTKPIHVKTDLVTLTLTVTDLYGRYVSGLTKNAFSVL